MKWKTKNTILLLFFLIAIPLVSFIVYSRVPSEWRWSPNISFHLPATNCSVQFNDWLYFNNFTWNDVNASEITFNGVAEKPSYVLNQLYNLTTDYDADALTLFFNSSEGVADQDYYVGLERLMVGMRYEAINNGTLSAPTENGALRRLTATVTVITNKSQVQIYTAGYRPRYVKVAGSYIDRDEWTYNRRTKMLLFNVTGSPPHATEAIFGITDEEGLVVGAIGTGATATTGASKKIGKIKPKHSKWIQRATIIISLLILLVMLLWVVGIYMEWI